MDQQTTHPDRQSAHPRAQDLMDEAFYFDQNDGTGPFGNDDGMDAFNEFVYWRRKNSDGSTYEFLNDLLEEWEYPLFDLSVRNYRLLIPYLKKSEMHIYYQIGIDQVIIAVGFAQLYLEGEVDHELLDLTIAAVERQNDPPMLSTWGEEYRDTRQIKLGKMEKVLRNLLQ